MGLKLINYLNIVVIRRVYFKIYDFEDLMIYLIESIIIKCLFNSINDCKNKFSYVILMFKEYFIRLIICRPILTHWFWKRKYKIKTTLVHFILVTC